MDNGMNMSTYVLKSLQFVLGVFGGETIWKKRWLKDKAVKMMFGFPGMGKGDRH